MHNNENISQDQMRSANSKHYINAFYFNNEEFRRISDYDPEVADHFYISNYGKVYSAYTNMIMTTQISNAGYEMVNLSLKDKNDRKSKPMSIHRLVMLCFCPIPNADEMQVNHIDGVKTHNWLSNLEWVTRSENMKHCYRNNLEINGEDHPWATITEEVVHEICRKLQEGMSNPDIAELVLGDRKRDGLVNSIRIGNAWVNVSQYYDIPPSDLTQHFRKQFNNEELSRAYFLIEDGLSNREIAKIIDPDFSCKCSEDKDRVIRVLRNLRNKVMYSYIPTMTRKELGM